MGNEIAYVENPIEEREHRKKREKYTHATFLSEEERKILRSDYELNKRHNPGNLTYDEILAEFTELHRMREASRQAPSKTSTVSKETKTEPLGSKSSKPTGQTEPSKTPERSKKSTSPRKKDTSAKSGEGFAKLQEINKRRKAKEEFEKGIIKYYKGVKTYYLRSCPNRRERESTRAKFKRFENRAVKGGLGWGSTRFVDELKQEFPDIQWQAEVHDFNQPLTIEDTPEGVATLKEEKTDQLYEQNKKEQSVTRGITTDAVKQDKSGDKKQESTPSIEKKSEPASGADGAIKDFLQKPPLEQINTASELSGQVQQGLTQVVDNTKKDLPIIEELPTGIKAGLKAKEKDTGEITVPEIPSLSDDQKVVKAETLIDMPLVQEPNGDISADEIEQTRPDLGEAPGVPLSGAANPERIDDFEGKTSQVVNDVSKIAQSKSTADVDLNGISPEVDADQLKPNIEEVVIKEVPSVEVGPLTQKVPDIEGKLNEEAAKTVREKLAEEETKLSEATTQLDSKKNEAKVDFEKKMSAEIASTTAEQEAAKKKAEGQTVIHQRSWQEENKKLLDNYETESKKAKEQTRQQIDAEVEKTNKETSAKISQAQIDADQAVKDAEGKVEEKKEEAKKEKGWLDKASDYVSDVFDALKSIVSSIFNTLISVVNAVIEAAKKAVSVLIDKATQLVVGFIKVFGEVLRMAVKVLFAALPTVAKKFEALIDRAIEFAIHTVQKLANLLKKAIQGLLDILGKVIIAYIKVYQTIVNLVVKAVELVARMVKGILRGIINLVLAAKNSPKHFGAELSKEVLGVDVTQPLPNERPMVPGTTTPAASELTDVAETVGLETNDSSTIAKTSYQPSDIKVDPFEDDLELHQKLVRHFYLTGFETQEFGENDKKENDLNAVKKEALTGETPKNTQFSGSESGTSSVESNQSTDQGLVGPFASSLERGKYIGKTVLKGMLEVFNQYKVQIILGLIGAITGFILLNILTGGAITAALPALMQVFSIVFGAKAIVDVAALLGKYITASWPGRLVEGATALAAAFAKLIMELVGALPGAKGAVKSVRVLGKHAAKKRIKSTMKLSAKMMKRRAIGTAKTTVGNVNKLKQIGTSGAKAAVKNGKLVLKGVKKTAVKSAKTLKSLGKSLRRNARFKKFRIRFEKGRFFLEGKINPWVLLASGKLKHFDDADPRFKGKKVGDQVDIDGQSGKIVSDTDAQKRLKNGDDVKVNSKVESAYKDVRLGSEVGFGGNKIVYEIAGEPDKVIAILKKGKPETAITDEIALLNKLDFEGLSTVKIIEQTTHNGQPAILMKRYAQGSKDVVKLVGKRVKIVGDSKLLNFQSISDLKKIQQIMVNQKVKIDDLQFLIGKDGSMVIADPLRVFIGRPPSSNNLRMIRLLIEQARKNIR